MADTGGLADEQKPIHVQMSAGQAMSLYDWRKRDIDRVDFDDAKGYSRRSD